MSDGEGHHEEEGEREGMGHGIYKRGRIWLVLIPVQVYTFIQCICYPLEGA